MRLDQICKKGEIKIDEFIRNTIRSPVSGIGHLNVGDFLIISIGIKEDVLNLEKVTELDYLEHGDFLTEKGTTGPYNGNLFLKLNKDGTPRFIEGEHPYKGEGSVYEALYNYLRDIKEGKRKVYGNAEMLRYARGIPLLT